MTHPTLHRRCLFRLWLVVLFEETSLLANIPGDSSSCGTVRPHATLIRHLHRELVRTWVASVVLPRSCLVPSRSRGSRLRDRKVVGVLDIVRVVRSRRLLTFVFVVTVENEFLHLPFSFSLAVPYSLSNHFFPSPFDSQRRWRIADTEMMTILLLTVLE